MQPSSIITDKFENYGFSVFMHIMMNGYAIPVFNYIPGTPLDDFGDPVNILSQKELENHPFKNPPAICIPNSFRQVISVSHDQGKSPEDVSEWIIENIIKPKIKS
jgi:hypothetical protein